jgi:hypothetical protein
MIASHGHDVIKAIGLYVSIAGFVAGGLKWVFAVFKKLTSINATIESLTTNHFPHLSATLDAHTEALQGIKLDVGILGTRMENHETRLNDTREGLKAVHTTLIKYLEDSAKKRKK